MLTGGIFAALFFYFIPKNDSGQTNNYSYQFGPDVGYTLRRTVSWDVARYNDRLYNCGIVIHNGGIKGIVPKIYNPTYNEFYESRWFSSGAEFRLEAMKQDEQGR